MEGGRAGVKSDGKYYRQGGDGELEELMENEAFCNGIAVGINLHQQKVVRAHERKEFIKIGEPLYYIQDGRERLKEAVDKICR